MNESTKCIAMPLGDLTTDQLEARSRKARDLHSRIEGQPREACSAYQLLAIPEVLRYLDLIAQEAEFEFTFRDLPNELMGQRNRLLAVEPSPSAGQDLRSFFAEFESTGADVKRVQAFLFKVPKLLEKIRIELAAISTQEINCYLGAFGVPEHDPLRPPMPISPSTEAEITDSTKLSPEVKEFRQFLARCWKERRKNRRGKRSSVADIMVIARECDAKKIRPATPFIERTLDDQINEWNLKFPERRIAKFEDMVKRSIEPNGSAAFPQPQFNLGVFRKFLANTASNLAQKQG